MGRRAKQQALGVWINGEFIGRWSVSSRGEHAFEYDPAWRASEYGRSISLSMPLYGNRQFRGDIVKNYFDNLLPDNDQIRTRIQQRFGASSISPFDLLTQIGRDCVGAVQLLPEGDTPGDVRQIEAEAIDEQKIERILRNVPVLGQQLEEEDFRVSLAGAQEKTALLFHQGQWMRPLGATPTTHILKLPIGRHSDHGIDLSLSVENEWLCAKILEAYGISTSQCWPAVFGQQSALVVERFDRRLSANGQWYLRLPQEDMCQAMGIPPAQKYERDGGPGMREIMNLLLGSSQSQSDRTDFFKTQVIFWMLCAIDGHAKNFSIFLEPQGGYRMTPAYDILSAYPLIGVGQRSLQERKVKMAMALVGKNRHYRWSEMQRRHLESTAKACGFDEAGKAIINEVIAMTPAVIERVSILLPQSFPEQVAAPVLDGLAGTARRIQEGGEA